MQKEASFKLRTTNRSAPSGTWVSKVHGLGPTVEMDNIALLTEQKSYTGLHSPMEFLNSQYIERQFRQYYRSFRFRLIMPQQWESGSENRREPRHFGCRKKMSNYTAEASLGCSCCSSFCWLPASSGLSNTRQFIAPSQVRSALLPDSTLGS